MFVAGCEAGRIDDIIAVIHNTGCERVTIHERPEGSRPGTCNNTLEAENEGGVPEKLLRAMETFRCRREEKGSSRKTRKRQEKGK